MKKKRPRSQAANELSQSTKVKKAEAKYETAKKDSPPGEGGRFKAMKSVLKAKGAKDPGALAAHIGRKKYGAKKFGKMAAKGKG